MVIAMFLARFFRFGAQRRAPDPQPLPSGRRRYKFPQPQAAWKAAVQADA